MTVVRDARDLATRRDEAHDPFWHPTVYFLFEPEDHGFAVHFTQHHSPWHRPALVVPEVRRVDHSTGEPVGHTETSVGRNQVSEAIPVTAIESLDIET